MVQRLFLSAATKIKQTKEQCYMTKQKGKVKSMGNIKRKKHKSDKPLTREEELLLENEALRCELDYLKKLQALIQAEEKVKKLKP